GQCQGRKRKPQRSAGSAATEHRTGEHFGRSRTLDAGRSDQRLVVGGMKKGEARPPCTPATWRTWGKQAKRARGQRPLSWGSSLPPSGGLSLWSVATSGYAKRSAAKAAALKRNRREIQ